MRMYMGLVLGFVGRVLRSRNDLLMENLVLRQQLAVYARRSTKPQLRNEDRIFWSVVARREGIEDRHPHDLDSSPRPERERSSRASDRDAPPGVSGPHDRAQRAPSLASAARVRRALQREAAAPDARSGFTGWQSPATEAR